MNRMAKETRVLLCSVILICMFSVIGSIVLISWLTKDFQRTIVEHDYGVAGYLTNHSDTNLLFAFTKDKSDSDLKAGEQALAMVGYSEDTNSGFIPAVAIYKTRITGIFSILLLSIFTAIFFVFYLYIKKQREVFAKADTVITCFLEGDTDKRIDSEETGDWYRLFHRINELATVLSAHAEHEKQTRRFLQDMISDVSHQLKTPLAALKMYDEIIAEESTDREAIYEFSQKSLREIRRVEDVVYTLLKLAKLDAGTIQMEKEDENIEMLMCDVTERFELLAMQEAKEIILSGETDITLFCDALWISEAVGNIVKNALEHTEQGGTIMISWEKTPLLTNIIIEDNGKGIHPEDIHNVFKRFYRSRFSQDTHGIGLGLPLAKAIVESHNGTISVISRVGQGSKFILSFYNLTKE